MPQAVDSNSRTVSDSQEDEFSLGIVSSDLEDLHGAFAMLTAFAADEIEKNQDNEGGVSWGYVYMKNIALERLETLRQRVRAASKAETDRRIAEANLRRRYANGRVWPELLARVTALVEDTMRTAGYNLPKDDRYSWAEDDKTMIWEAGIRYYQRIMDKLEGDLDPLMAGSLLPWLEHVMRRDMIGKDATTAPLSASASAIADRLEGVEQTQADDFQKAV